jgi:hypothetical protein
LVVVVVVVRRSKMSSFIEESSSSFDLGRDYYYSITLDDDDPARTLGAVNLTAALGNPLKGLLGSPWFGDTYHYNSSVPSSLEWFYIGLQDIMVGDPDIVGIDAAFDWTEIESRFAEIASRGKHAVFTTVVHYPGWDGLCIPQYLLDAGLELHYFGELMGSNYTPDYGDPMLLKAFQHYISALGARYDGDPRIGFIHLGLLGFWVRKLVCFLLRANMVLDEFEI